MKFLSKILKVIGASLLTLLFGLTVFIYTITPTLPDGTNKIIKEVIKNPLPELITGQTGIAKSHGLNIWYESILPKTPSKGAILLNMGIANDGLAWPVQFIQALLDSGYQVIRYDYRGTGMSDWVDDWDKSHPYPLVDMADDAIAILDTLHIEKAHVIGVSMGGMVAQEMAINHPERLLSLTSIMSSGFITDPAMPKASNDLVVKLVATALRYGIIGGEKNMSKLFLSIRMILVGDSKVDLNQKEMAEQVIYNIRHRKGFNKRVSQQHQAAVNLSGSRYHKLKQLQMPTLIIHGKQDPFISIAHGRKCAEIIRYADTLWVDNMGHDLPNESLKPIIAKIVSNFDRRKP
ncbi:MAG: alpha/beta hydrolase [Saprospiraceae bacterium]